MSFETEENFFINIDDLDEAMVESPKTFVDSLSIRFAFPLWQPEQLQPAEFDAESQNFTL